MSMNSEEGQIMTSDNTRRVLEATVEHIMDGGLGKDILAAGENGRPYKVPEKFFSATPVKGQEMVLVLSGYYSGYVEMAYPKPESADAWTSGIGGGEKAYREKATDDGVLFLLQSERASIELIHLELDFDVEWVSGWSRVDATNFQAEVMVPYGKETTYRNALHLAGFRENCTLERRIGGDQEDSP